MRGRRDGFTIIELLVAIANLALLVYYGDVMAMNGLGALLLNARNVLLILLGLELAGWIPAMPRRAAIPAAAVPHT